MLRTRAWQVLLIVSILGLSWLGMMAVHELGHVLNAWLSGGRVVGVVLHPLTISRTDIAPNPHPQFVAWGGAMLGTLMPLAMLAIGWLMIPRYSYLLAFFAGFCCLANGLYLAIGSFAGIGDAGDLLRHGAPRWELILFGVPFSLLGLWLWNGLGAHFGLGAAGGNVDRTAAAGLAIALLLVFVIEVLLAVP
jgi:Peptidase M50B-like